MSPLMVTNDKSVDYYILHWNAIFITTAGTFVFTASFSLLGAILHFPWDISRLRVIIVWMITWSFLILSSFSIQVLNQAQILIVAFVAGVPSIFRTAFEVYQTSVSLVMVTHVRVAKKAKGYERSYDQRNAFQLAKVRLYLRSGHKAQYCTTTSRTVCLSWKWKYPKTLYGQLNVGVSLNFSRLLLSLSPET